MRVLTVDEIGFVAGGGREDLPKPSLPTPRDHPGKKVEVITVRPHPDQYYRALDLHLANVSHYYAGRLSDWDQGGDEIIPGFQELYDLLKAGMQDETKRFVLRSLPKLRAFLASIPNSEDATMFWHPQYGVFTDIR